MFLTQASFTDGLERRVSSAYNHQGIDAITSGEVKVDEDQNKIYAKGGARLLFVSLDKVLEGAKVFEGPQASRL
jgi:hypothetical protein